MSTVAQNVAKRDTSSENTGRFKASATVHTWPSIITSQNHTADIQESGAAISASRNSHQTRRREFASSWRSAGFLRKVASQTMNHSNSKAGLFLTTETSRDQLCQRELAAQRAPTGPYSFGYPSFVYTLSSLCSLLSRFSLPSPFYLLFQCSPFQCPVVVSCSLILACYGGIAEPWATKSTEGKRRLFFPLRLLRE